MDIALYWIEALVQVLLFFNFLQKAINKNSKTIDKF